VNFYRAMQNREPTAIAQAVALTFMGTRVNQWPAERLTNTAVFFSPISFKATSEWKEEIVYLDPMKSLPGKATLPDGTVVTLTPGVDARRVFVDWLVAPNNPWYSRAIVNRIWYWLLGRGIVHEPDDLRANNPPANAELLAYLEKELVSSDWDLRHIYRLILNSQIYQLSSLPRSRNVPAAINFSSYPLRRLDAEVLIDIICQVTGTTERYVSAVPEPFTYIPEDMHTICLSDGNSSSSFLELFGRPARETGLVSERNNTINAGQHLHLLNSTHIHNKIAHGPALAKLASDNKRPPEIVKALYLTILSRYPTESEIQAITTYRDTSGLNGRDLLTDLAWAMINSEEFLNRH
ncbi:MAG: DUF1553 domain-containing protein, partial [Kiritimatiellia bacterium]